jgi:hypothetical protein
LLHFPCKSCFSKAACKAFDPIPLGMDNTTGVRVARLNETACLFNSGPSTKTYYYLIQYSSVIDYFYNHCQFTIVWTVGNNGSSANFD